MRTEHQEEVPEPKQQPVEEILSPPVLASSSSSPDKAILSSMLSCHPDFKVHQELLKTVLLLRCVPAWPHKRASKTAHLISGAGAQP